MKSVSVTTKRASVLLLALCLILSLAACTQKPVSSDPTAEPVQNTDEAAAATEEAAPTEAAAPTDAPDAELPVPEKVVYGFDGGGITSPTEPRADEPPAVSNALRAAMEDPANAGAYFAVVLRPAVEDGADEAAKARISELITSGPIAQRAAALAAFEAELMNDWDRYVKLNETYGAEGVEMLFDRDWRAEAGSEEQAAYDEAQEQVKALRDEVFGDAVREQVAFLRERGYSVRYEHGAEIFGYLTAGQLHDFPADKTCAYYAVDWVRDPSFTADALLAALDG